MNHTNVASLSHVVGSTTGEPVQKRSGHSL